MAFNGSGSYSPPGASFPAVSGALIESAKFNNIINDVASALSTAICKDGQTTITANLPMAGFRHTGVGNAVSTDDYAAYGQVQNSSSHWAGTAGGTGNAITLTLTPAITAYAAGQSFTYKSSASANTGAMTVAINGLATKAIQKNGAALASGNHPANMWFRITYDGAAFQLEQIAPDTATITTSLALKANLASPDFTGLPTTAADPTAALGLATKQYVDAIGAGIRGLRARTNATTPLSKIDVTADDLILKSTTGSKAKYFPAVSVTGDITASGANGLDTGTEAINTWYYGWVIGKEDGTVACLISASSSAPTVPSGYVYKLLVTTVRNNASSNFIPYRQMGKTIYYEGRQMAISAGSSTAEISVDMSSLVPSVADCVRLIADGTVTADGSGVVTADLVFGFIASSAFAVFSFSSGSLGVSAISKVINGSWEHPNIDLRYKWTLTTGTSPSVNCYVTSFSLPF